MSTTQRLTIMLAGAPPTSLELAAIEGAFQAAGFGEVQKEMHSIPEDLKMAVDEPAVEIQSTHETFKSRRPDFAKVLAKLRTDVPNFGLMLLLVGEDRRSTFAWRRSESAEEVLDSVGALPVELNGSYGWQSATRSWIRI